MARRSTGLPTSRGISGLTRVIGARSRSVTVTRPTTTTNALDETTETTSSHSEMLYLFENRESESTEIAGERIEGTLGGLTVADGTVDLQPADRVTYGGVEYEVDTIVGQPIDGAADGTNSPNTDFWVVSFTRRQ